MPLLVAFWILLVFLLLKKYISGFLVNKFPGVFKVCDIELDEDIGKYYECLDEHDRNWSVKEEENCRDNLKFSILDDDTLDKMKNTPMGAATIQGCLLYTSPSPRDS